MAKVNNLLYFHSEVIEGASVDEGDLHIREHIKNALHEFDLRAEKKGFLIKGKPYAMLQQNMFTHKSDIIIRALGTFRKKHAIKRFVNTKPKAIDTVTLFGNDDAA